MRHPSVCTLHALRLHAKASARLQGHTLGPWATLNLASASECYCGAWVQVTIAPKANETFVAGPAISKACIHLYG